MLLVCFGIATLFYWHYFKWHSDYLIINIQIFVGSMLFLILTQRRVNRFIGWEYLRVRSFFLILYYSIYCSTRSALITLIRSRLGDIGFLILILCRRADFEINFAYGIIFICFLLIRKTAVYPMSRWLLEAMRAPTPVRSLVHSSTLVASGVWLLSRYEGMLLSGFHSNLLLILRILRVIIRARCAFFYSDTKKIIALSTCKKIRWCYIYIYMGLLEIGILQLVRHGIFKCIMFCLIGDLLIKSSRRQRKRMHFIKRSVGFNFAIVLTSLFIRGSPFLGVYFSKHLFISYIRNRINLLITTCIIIGIRLSFLYTFRLIKVILKLTSSSREGFKKRFYFSIMLLPRTIILNLILTKTFIEERLPGYKESILIKSAILVMRVLGYNLVFKRERSWLSRLSGQDALISISSRIEGSIEKICYSIRVWRWEYFTINYIKNLRKTKKTPGLNYIFICSLMFYLILLAY